MKAKLYRLFAIQDFGRRVDVGENIAVYVNTGEMVDPEILTDAQELSRNMFDKYELYKRKPYLYENNGVKDGDWSPVKDKNRLALKFLVRVFEWGHKVSKKDPTVKYAIFVESTNKRDWHGEKMLYLNTYLDEVKTHVKNHSGTDVFSGCAPVKTIKL